MKAASPALTTVSWTPRLASFLEETLLAIARLDARISASPVREAWSLRASWTGYSIAQQLQGLEIDEADTFSWAIGVALPQRPLRPSLDDPFDGFSAWRDALGAKGRHWREDLPFTVELPVTWQDAPALCRALEITRQHARADRTARAWLQLPLLLQRLGITVTPLPCLVSGAKAFRFDRLDADTTVIAQLRQLARLANDGLDRLEALEADRLRAIQAIAVYRRPGALMPLLALLHHRPVLSPEKAAQMLGLTVSGAGKLLTKAAAAGLVREVSGRGSWRVYIVPDLAVHFGYAAAPMGRPRKVRALSPDLDVVLAAFDKEMAALAPMLANHDSSPTARSEDFPI